MNRYVQLLVCIYDSIDIILKSYVYWCFPVWYLIHVINCRANYVMNYRSNISYLTPFLSSKLDISWLCSLKNSLCSLNITVFTYLMFTFLFTFCLESWYCLEIFWCAPLPAGSYLDSPLSDAVYMKIISIIVIICHLMR